jgi:hypothetical protein
MLFEFNEMNNSESDKKCESEMMKIFAPVLERNRFLILILKDKNANYFSLERNLRTGGHLIEFHLIESVDRIFRSNA